MDIVVKNEELKIQLNSNDINSIITFGKEVSNKISESSKNVLKTLDATSSGKEKDIIKNLDNVFRKIDTNELTQMSKNQTGIKKIFGLITNKKNQIVTKYTSISNELNEMYVGIKQWENQLMSNNGLLNQRKNDCSEAFEMIKNYIEVAEQELDLMIENYEPTSENNEKISLIRQKIADLKIQKTVCGQTINNIDTIKKTNYSIYKKINSVYDSTMPVIEMTIASQMITSQHQKILNDLKIVDKKRDELLVDGAKRMVDAGIDAINILNSNSGLEALKQAKTLIDDGKKQMEELENKKIIMLENMLKNMKESE